ncbi:MAG: TRAP transporter small permease [Christensenellales bacterium]
MRGAAAAVLDEPCRRGRCVPPRQIHRFGSVYQKMPVKVQKVLEIVVLVLMQVAFCIFIYYGVMLSIKSWKRSFQTLPISYSFVTIALPVMSTLMTLTNILKIIDKVKNFKKNVALAMEKGKA